MVYKKVVLNSVPQLDLPIIEQISGQNMSNLHTYIATKEGTVYYEKYGINK